MNLLRKVFWPSAIALSMLVALAAIGQGVGSVDAAPDVVEHLRPKPDRRRRDEGYLVLIDDYDGPVIVDLDDNEGDTDITSKSGPAGWSDDDDEDDEDNRSPANRIHGLRHFALPIETARRRRRRNADDLFELAEDEFGLDISDCFLAILLGSEPLSSGRTSPTGSPS